MVGYTVRQTSVVRGAFETLKQTRRVKKAAAAAAAYDCGGGFIQSDVSSPAIADISGVAVGSLLSFLITRRLRFTSGAAAAFIATSCSC